MVDKLYHIKLHIPGWLLSKSPTGPDLQPCLLVSAALWWTGCLLLLPGRSPRAAHRAHQCPGRSRVPLTWGDTHHEGKDEGRTPTLLIRRSQAGQRQQVHSSVRVTLTSPWLVLFPGSLCWPPPFPWKQDIWDRQFYFHFCESALKCRNYKSQGGDVCVWCHSRSVPVEAHLQQAL